MNKDQITIDGPAGSGKSTVARLVAQRIGGYYINTGDMYRAVTLAALDAGVNVQTQTKEVARLMENLELDCAVSEGNEPQLILNSRILSEGELRTPAITQGVSYVAAVPEVRQQLVAIQRGTTKLGVVVVEGRDIGTVVFPEAANKFYLLATPEERARRRLLERHETSDKDAIRRKAAEIQKRDSMDSTRETAPLREPEDAVEIDTTALSAAEVAEGIIEHLPDGLKMK